MQWAVVIGLCGLAVSQGEAATIFVDDTGVDSGSCGNSAASACRHIQYAYVNRAQANDEIRVLPGSYNECVDASALAFDPRLVRPVRIRADAFVTGSNRSTTIISGSGVCDALSADPRPVVTLGGNGTTLEGFTVRNGGDSGVLGFGGVVVTNNIITANSSLAGGGVFVYTYNCYYGDTDSVIDGNDITGNAALGDRGGGVYVQAGGVPRAECVSGDASVTISDNLIADNTLDGDYGAGLAVFTKTEEGQSTHVVITQNDIDGNVMVAGSAGYGGGIWASTYGYGSETIEIVDNDVRSNVSTADGGGISAWVDALELAEHTIRVDRNTVMDNQAANNGGGMDVLVRAEDLLAGQRATLAAARNTVARNSCTTLNDAAPYGGGGILAQSLSIRSSAGRMHLGIVGNEVIDNDADLAGGGITLAAISLSAADADDPAAPAAASIDTSNNVVARNEAGVGGGIYALLVAEGDAAASATVDLSTITDNSAEAGGGGIEVESFTQLDGAAEGDALLTVRDSIVADNASFAIGGPRPGFPAGTGNLHVDVSFSDFFGNAGLFEPTLLVPEPPPADPPALRQTALRFDNPQLNASYSHGLCSRIGAASPSSLPDVNRDDFVDGIDILRVASAFGATPDSARYGPLSDIDGSGMVDGDDLAILAAAFAEGCGD